MADPSTLESLARRLNYAGLALLLAAALAFVWAVGFTRGVEGLLEGLVLAGVGLFLPAVATLWIASIIGGAAATHPRPREAPRVERRWTRVVATYLAAAAAVAIAALVRWWLTPWLGHESPYVTFLLAVAVATWIGGIVPGALAAFASLVVVWELFRGPPAAPIVQDTARWVGAILFLTVSLSIAGITSALRVARSGGLALREELDWRDAEREELEATLRAVADESPEMLWTLAADGRLSYVNRSWSAFTGQPREAAVGDGWQSGIHPDDVGEWRQLVQRAVSQRKAFTVEYRRKRHDGVYRRVVDEARPRTLGEHGFAGYLGRTLDASQRSRDASHAASAAGPGTP